MLGSIEERTSTSEIHLFRDEGGAILRLPQDLLGELPEVEARNHCNHRQDEQRNCQRKLRFKAEPHLAALPRILSTYCGGSSSLYRAGPPRAFCSDSWRPASGELIRAPPRQRWCRLGIEDRRDRKPSSQPCARNRREDAG